MFPVILPVECTNCETVSNVRVPDVHMEEIEFVEPGRLTGTACRRCGGPVTVPIGKYRFTHAGGHLIAGPVHTQKVVQQILFQQGERRNPDFSGPVYRYMNSRWTEKLRKDGEFRISPITKYQPSAVSELTGDIREDATEGTKRHFIHGPGAVGHEFSNALGVSFNRLIMTPDCKGQILHQSNLPQGYLLSTSLNESKTLCERFACDDYFEIIDVVRFKDAVRSAIAMHYKVPRAIDGYVQYVGDKDTRFSLDDLNRMGPTGIRPPNTNEFFRKPDSYQIEREFRFIFLVESGVAIEPITLKLCRGEVRSICRFKDDRERLNTPRTDRNAPCWCGSGKKHKKCHGS